jgi:hypothetical protein
MKTYNEAEKKTIQPIDDGNFEKRRTTHRAVKLLALVLPFMLLNGCAINWQKEWRETNWNRDKGSSFGQYAAAPQEQLSMRYTDRFSRSRNRPAAKTVLSAAGVKIMNEQGCLGCHEGDGSLSLSALSDRFYTVAPRDEVTAKTVFSGLSH